MRLCPPASWAALPARLCPTAWHWPRPRSCSACPAVSAFLCGQRLRRESQGLFAFGYSLAQLVTAIQAGFSTYWGPYVYAHYREEQERICRVHDVLNLLIFSFFCALVMFEDIVFVIFPDKRGCLAIFPLLMLAVVFNILCEGTVYGNSIARKPWHDTIGIGLGALSNLGLCAVLVPAFGLTGAALALAASNGIAFCTAASRARCTTAPSPAMPRRFPAFAGVRGHSHRHAAVAAFYYKNLRW